MEQIRDAVRRIMISVNVVDGIYAIEAKKAGIKYNTLSLLYALDDGNPHSQKEICEQWLIPKTTINTVVKECVDAGYIELENSGKSNKEKIVRLTKRGREYARKILDQVYEMENRAMAKTLEAFSPEYIKAIEQFTAYLKEEAENVHDGD